jgi:hypothetical protein
MVIYEIVSIIAFIAAFLWTLRSRDPLCMGALLGGILLFGFDWLWCGRAFFNATFADGLFLIPGIAIQGQTYPIAVALNWSVGFGFLPYLLSAYHGAISARLGILHYPIALAVGAAIDMAAEIPLVSGLGVYTYHQAPEYLLCGVPWSNLWFGGNLVAMSYFGLAYARRWAALPPRNGFALGSENTWKGFTLSAAALYTAFFFSTVVQLFWYSAAAPWVESGRPF